MEKKVFLFAKIKVAATLRRFHIEKLPDDIVLKFRLSSEDWIFGLVEIFVSSKSISCFESVSWVKGQIGNRNVETFSWEKLLVLSIFQTLNVNN